MAQVFNKNDIVELISGEFRGIILKESAAFENAIIIRITWVNKNSTYKEYANKEITVPKQHLKKI